MTNSLLSFSRFVPSRSRLIVGISGGCDSVALLRLLVEHWPNPSQKLVAAHVNYGLRGKQSQADEQWVRSVCSRWKIPLRILKVRGFKKSSKTIKNPSKTMPDNYAIPFFSN